MVRLCWRESSAVKGVCCSCTGPMFTLDYMEQLRIAITVAPGPDALFWPLQAPTCTCTAPATPPKHIYTNQRQMGSYFRRYIFTKATLNCLYCRSNLAKAAWDFKRNKATTPSSCPHKLSTVRKALSRQRLHQWGTGSGDTYLWADTSEQTECTRCPQASSGPQCHAAETPGSRCQTWAISSLQRKA